MSGETPQMRLRRAASREFLDGRLTPAEMKCLCFLIERGYIQPHYLPASAWAETAALFEISVDWLSKTLRRLYQSHILTRDNADGKHLPGYAVNPDWGPDAPTQE